MRFYLDPCGLLPTSNPPLHSKSNPVLWCSTKNLLLELSSSDAKKSVIPSNH